MAYAFVTRWIPGNNTFTTGNDHKLIVTFQITAHQTSVTVPIVTLKNKPSALHFLSCGSQGVEGLPFLEFANVFDKYIWITLILAIILLVLWDPSILSETNRFDSTNKLVFLLKYFKNKAIRFHRKKT